MAQWHNESANAINRLPNSLVTLRCQSLPVSKIVSHCKACKTATDFPAAGQNDLAFLSGPQNLKRPSKLQILHGAYVFEFWACFGKDRGQLRGWTPNLVESKG